MSGVRSVRRSSASAVCLLAALVAWASLAAPAAGATTWFELGCSPVTTAEDGTRSFDPGAEVDCYLYMTEPEGPFVSVELRRAGTDETVALYGGDGEWEDHEAWFSFVVPTSARPGDLVVIDISQGLVDGRGDPIEETFVFQIAGESPPPPPPPPPAPPTEGDVVPADPAEPADEVIEPEVEEPAGDAGVVRESLPVTGRTLTALTILGLGAAAVGGALLALDRRRSRRGSALAVCLLVALVAWAGPAAPAVGAAQESITLERCSPVTTGEDGTRYLDPGVRVDCIISMWEPEPPFVLVELRRAGTGEVEVVYDGGFPNQPPEVGDSEVDWDDHFAWFSFVVPASARPGDLVVLSVTHSRHAGAPPPPLSVVFQIAGESPPQPPAPPTEGGAEPTDPAEPADEVTEPEVVEQESDAGAARESLPVTGRTLTALTILGLGVTAIGGALLALDRRRSRPA